MSAELRVICARCYATLYECPMCGEIYHRANVLLNDSGPVCCMQCVEKWAGMGPLRPDAAALLVKHARRFGLDTYSPALEIACA